MEEIKAEEVEHHLGGDIRRLGIINFSLISRWDRWVRRRVEQVELISDAAARRRLSVDFRLHRSQFGEGMAREGDRKVHYVPLTLLHKAPVSNFDLRDESGTAIPLLTKRKTSSICAATLSAATRTMVVQQMLSRGSQAKMGAAIRDTENPFDIESIRVPAQIEAQFLNLCAFPYDRRADGSEKTTAKEIHGRLIGKTAGKKFVPVSSWPWTFDGEENEWFAEGVSDDTWILGITKDQTLRTLVYDLTRLYMVAAPIEDEPERRRLIKLEYEEHYSEPGLKIVGGIRHALPAQSSSIRRREDRLEGLVGGDDVSLREWTRPRTGMTNQPRQKLGEALASGIGWKSKPISFQLPSLGFGGTFHLEVTAPLGTQLRRAELRAVETGQKLKVRDQIANRYARNVARAHLYLGGPREGTYGDASIYIKPKSSTVIRGAALAATTLWAMVLVALALGGSPEGEPRTSIAILLLAPGLLAAIASQRFDHGITAKMVFGLRLLAMGVAGVAIVAAALLGTQTRFCDQPVLWSFLIVSATGLMGILVGAWRLAGRDWPRRLTL
jgi:hypothetical protein